MNGYILGLDIGGTNLRMGLVSSDYKVSDISIIKSKDVFSKEDSAIGISEAIKDYIRKSGKKIIGVSAGFPSLVDKERRRLLSSTNFPGLDSVDIVAVLEETLGLPVKIDHDAYFILLNDMVSHDVAFRGCNLGFYFGTGLGAAIYFDDVPYYGKHGSAAEIGHMPVPMGDRECLCGNKGCIEMYSCGKSFERLWMERFSDVPLPDVFSAYGEDEAITGFLRYMAAPVATSINMLDPENVFLGGGIIYMKDFPKQRLQEYIMENVRHPYPYLDTSIIFSENSPENGIRGAGIAAFRSIR